MTLTTYRRWMAMLIVAGAFASPATAQTLGIPSVDRSGAPVDVGLLILGHSTSAAGDWPGKLAAAMNGDPQDGRNYVVFRAITGGDGGFLWTGLAYPPGDLQYDRVRGSSAASVPPQWCEDGATRVRYSCRRTKLEWALRGQNPLPAASNCRGALAGCSPPATVACVWHEDGERFAESLPFHDCWTRMDVRLALVQDTANRSWPVDDYTGNGTVDGADYFEASAIRSEAWRCPPGSANPAGVLTAAGTTWIDWNCDRLLTGADAAAVVYAGWLEGLALDLLTKFGVDGVQDVFITQKPVEMASLCPRFFPGEACGPHFTRMPTPSRPFDRFYLPTVYWEYRAVETLFASPSLDSRIHLIAPGTGPRIPIVTGNARAMWDRSAQCYEQGMLPGDWTIPASGGHPIGIKADDFETDAGPRADAGRVGCLGSDHVHHNDDGGWMMADVWYSGLWPYLH